MNGVGTLFLSGNNSYNGSTIIQTGTVSLVSSTTNNNIASSPKIIVGDSAVDNGAILTVTGITTLGGFQLASGQTLGGLGTVKGSTTLLGDILAPGNSIGTLTIDGTGVTAPALTLATGASILEELNNSILSDQLALIHGVANDIAFNNNVINFSDLSSGTLASGQYTFVSPPIRPMPTRA